MAYDIDPDEFALPQLNHAMTIVNDRASKNYGIYLLCHEKKGGDQYYGLTHVNCARLPRTTGKTLRINWTLLSPQFDYTDVSQDVLTVFSASIVHGLMTLAQEGHEMPADHVKIRLINIGDRRYVVGFAKALEYQKMASDVAVKGNWLHIDNIKPLEGPKS